MLTNALALDELPSIVSPTINLSCADMNRRPLTKSSAKTVVVAFDVWPVTVSPLVNLPNVELSKIILSPASSCVLSVSKREPSNSSSLVWEVSVSNKIPSVVWTEVTVNSADSINV